MTKTIDFNDLSSGTIVDNEFQSQGVTIQAWTAEGAGNRAMIFDTSNPTGSDYDLATNNLGNALIISEDGDSDDPDDNARGGTFRFSYENGADVKSLTFLDNEEGATVRFYNEYGQLIATRQIGGTSNNGQQVVDFNVDGVFTMDVQINGSGAVDNLVFDDIVVPDGTVEGTAGDDLIDANYDGDPNGDFVDNNDAILPGDVANDDLIFGYGGDDSIIAGDGDDEVFGGTGDDQISAGDGDDIVSGDAGNDSIDGGAGNDVLEGGDGDDRIFGNDGNDTQFGGAGNDVLGGADYGDDVFFGGDGDDMVEASFGNDTIFGGAGNDDLWASSDDDVVYGGDGDDKAYGGHGQDVVYGDAGNDTLSGGSDNDTVFGGVGDDVIEGDTLFKDDNGAPGDDRLFGGDGNDTISGDGGDDMLFGGSGDDVISGGDGNDTVEASQGNDVIFGGAGNDDLWAGKGDDYVEAGDGDDIVEGGSGDDIIDGGAGNDEIFGGSDADVIFGGAGDTIDGGNGGDDYDVLDLTDQGPFILVGPDGTGQPVPDSNGNGTDGQVIFVDADGEPTGEVIDFTEIEQIIGNEVNLGPDADDDSFGADEDDAASGLGNVLGNDTDPNGDVLTVTTVGGEPAGEPVNGSDGGLVTINEDGSISFDPNGDFEELGEGETAETTITYTVDDGNGGTDTATVTITVTGTNDGPIATDNSYTVSADEAAGDVDGNAISEDTGVGSDSDVDDAQSDLTVSEVNGNAGNVGSVVDGSNGGLFTINEDGTIDFDANGDFLDLGAGETANTSVTYTIVDPDGAEDTATVNFTVNGTNDDPIACPDLYIVTEDEGMGDVDGNVITNPSDNNAGLDIDPDGDTLTVVGVNTPNGNVGDQVVGDNGGIFVINEDGSFDFSANGEFEALAPGESAETSVTYTVSDGNGGTATTTLTIRVDGVNDGPDAVDSSYVVGADEAVGDVDANAITDDTGEGADSDPEGDDLTVVAVDGEAANVGGTVVGDNGGLFTINADGTVDFDANDEFDGLGEGETASTSVTYTIADEDGLTDTATVTFTVTGSNDGPVAVADTGEATEDAPVDLDNVLSNDTDLDGDTLTVGAVGGDPANVGQPVAGDNGGLVTINEDGSASFDPNGEFEALGEGETAETTVTYTAVDPSGSESTTTVTITVTGVNDAPNAVDSAYVVSADEAAGDVDANAITDDTGEGADSDPEGDDLTVVAVDDEAANVGGTVVGDNGGLFTINADGTVDFDANDEFDGLGEGETASTSVTYTIADEDGLTDTATVTFTVTGSNDGPVAVADTGEATEDAPVDLDNVLSNDTDLDGDTLTVGAVGGDPANVGQPVAGDNGGLVTINEDGSASFDPNGEFEALGEGETAETTVTYTAVDPSGSESTTTVTITVTGVNDAPNAVDSAYVVSADEAAGDVDANAITDDTGEGADSDPEGDDLTVVAVDGEAANVGGTVVGDNGGLFTINADGTVDFDANDEFDGLGEGETASTSVTYTIADEDGLTDTATVTFTVTGSNDGPIAVADAFETNEDDVTDLGNVLDNDSDPDGDPLTVSEVNGDPDGVGTPVEGSNGGLVTINPDGTISFDPNGDFEELAPGETAETTITYTVTDPSGAEATETVTITVNGVNDGPEATDNAYVVTLSETAGDVDGNVITDDTGADVDSDPEGDDVTVVAVDGEDANVGQPVVGDNGGTFTINDDGTVDFDAGDDFDDLGLGATRDTSVTYTIEDENGARDTATVTFTVTGINDGTVQGTAGDDIINPDIPFVDADGDIVDAGDGILPGDEGTDNDVIEGFGGNDSIAAGNGNDVVFGGSGDDTVQGNLGNDVLFGGQGNDNVQGGLGNDIIDGGAGDDLLLGGDGNDTIAGGAGDDRVFGAEGDDELRGGSGNDTLEGSEGEDTLFGGTGDDDLWGGLDDDTVIGGSGNDTVAGEDGDDELHGGLGDDGIIDGGAGNDVISDVEGSDSVDAGDGDDVINVGSSQGDESPDVGYPEQPSTTIPGLVFPGYDADEDPNDDKDFVDGGAGNDIINTGDDDDSIIGGSGNDTINAGFDDDTVDGGTGDDLIEGGEGNDSIEGGEGDDLIFGGLEDPLADLVSFPDDEPDGFGFQDLVPENNGDELFGGAGNDTIFGQDDDDSLFGGTGSDFLDGGVDDDLIEGGDGSDELVGGQGNDDLSGDEGDDVLFGGDGEDLITGGEGKDVQFGGFGSDTFFGGNGGDVVVGGEDPDDSDIDVLDLTGSNVDRIDFVDGDPEAGTVTFLDGSTMTFSEIENVIPCFTPGTLIATPKGERLVEELQVGDRIITRDNGIQEIAWLGHKPMSGKQLVQNPHLQPVMIKRGALGHGLPERDMMVSPNHRVLVSGDKTQLYFEESEVLAAAKHMVGADGIQTVNMMQTTYVHFMFERHEVVLSNGAWTESFQPGDYSLKGIGNSQRNEIFDLFPELQSKAGLENYQSARKALKKHEAKLLLK